MPGRRTFLHLAIGGAALIRFTTGQVAQLPRPAAPGRPEGPHDFYKFVFDERFEASVAAAERHERRGIAVHGIRGDVTALWYDDLYHQWKHAPAPLAGVTTPESLFCLDVLARDAGLRVVDRHDEAGLVSWVIAPLRRA